MGIIIDHRQHNKRASQLMYRPAVSRAQVRTGGALAQRYGGMDERMSRKRPYRYSESGLLVYIPHCVRLKPNRSQI